MTRTDLDNLKRIASQATQDEHEWVYDKPASKEWKANRDANAAHCRAFRPSQALALIARIEALEAVAEAARDCFADDDDRHCPIDCGCNVCHMVRALRALDKGDS